MFLNVNIVLILIRGAQIYCTIILFYTSFFYCHLAWIKLTLDLYWPLGCSFSQLLAVWYTFTEQWAFLHLMLYLQPFKFASHTHETTLFVLLEAQTWNFETLIAFCWHSLVKCPKGTLADCFPTDNLGLIIFGGGHFTVASQRNSYLL